MSTDSEDTSMYAIGSESLHGTTQPKMRGRRGSGGKAKLKGLDFDACDVIGAGPLRSALLTRSQSALNYIADVIDDLESNAEVCAHVINTLAGTPDQIPCLTEMKRRCLISNLYTHSFYVKATFLTGSVRVRVKAQTEQAAKQAAHVALVKCLCEKVLAQ